MKCKAIVTSSPDQFSMSVLNVEDIECGAKVKVTYSSICGTDHQVISGDLLYYKNGIAKYPIVTGHEWCGIYNGQPVVGVCILGCNNCDVCIENHPIHCNARKEVGVVNKHGAHAEYVYVPESSLVSVPDVSPEYALAEPLAVCIHAIDRINLSLSDRILISGYGCIGRLCSKILDLRGHCYEIYDPYYAQYAKKPKYTFDVLIECSGTADALSDYMYLQGLSMLLFGFEYNDMSPAKIVSNEMTVVGTLGSNIEDLRRAVDMVQHVDMGFYKLLPLSRFRDGIETSKQGTKVVFNNRE